MSGNVPPWPVGAATTDHRRRGQNPRYRLPTVLEADVLGPWRHQQIWGLVRAHFWLILPLCLPTGEGPRGLPGGRPLRTLI